MMIYRILSFLLAGLFLFNCSEKKSVSRQTELINVSTVVDTTYLPVYDSIVAHLSQSFKRMDQYPQPIATPTKDWSFFFYWDSYYTNRGLLVTGNDSMAKNTTTTLLQTVERMGYVPNCILPWGHNRSQPAYLSLMVREVYEHSKIKDSLWLHWAVQVLKKEYAFWMNENGNKIEDHTTSIHGLVRYGAHPTKKESIEFYDGLTDRFDFPKKINDNEKIKFAYPYITEAASGWDFTPRFEGRCPDFVALDLNVLLYAYEKNFAYFSKELQVKEERDWEKLAEDRKKLINKYCWSRERNMYFDYDFINHRHSNIATVNTFLPLWFDIADSLQVQQVVKNISVFEEKWGIVPVQKSIQKLKYQWDYPTVWPPLQFMVYHGLDRQGYSTKAKEIALKYLKVVTHNFKDPIPATYTSNGKKVERSKGNVYEKYNGLNGKIYDTEYNAPEMMGWSTGVFLDAFHFINNK